MNTLLLLILAIPVFEIIVLIEIGSKIGALNTVFLIFLTAIIGVYFAKLQGLNTLKSGLLNAYQNKLPIYEIISGASIAFAAVLLILPGFITDTFGFFLLIPLTRKILIKLLLKKNPNTKENNIIDGEIIENKRDKDNEL